MKIKILDTLTGAIREVELDLDPINLQEGNYSCDCNRALCLSIEAPCGHSRFLITWSNHPDFDVATWNEGHPL